MLRIFGEKNSELSCIHCFLGLEFQANDMGDMDYDTMSGEVERKA